MTSMASLRVGHHASDIPGDASKRWHKRVLISGAGVPSSASVWDGDATEGETLMMAIDQYGYLEVADALAGQYDNGFTVRPYRHFAIVSSSGAGFGSVADGLHTFFRITFGDAATGEPFFRAYQAGSAQIRPTIMFGPGIFNPLPDAEPIGKLELRRDTDDAEWVSAKLQPGDSNDIEQEAGFYSGQTSLVAAFQRDKAPAFLDYGKLQGGDLPRNLELFFGIGPGTSEAGLHIRTGDTDAFRFVSELPQFLNFDAEEGLPVGIQGTRLRVRYTPDKRPEALHEVAPRGPHLKLIGILLPLSAQLNGGAGRDSIRIDLTDRQQLFSRPLQRRRLSVFSERPSFRQSTNWIFDWDSPRRINLPSRRPAVRHFSRRDYKLHTVEIRNPNDGVMGHVLTKSDDRNDTFGNVRISDAWLKTSNARSGLRVPWLNEAGILKDTNGEVSQLGSWLTGDGRLAMTFHPDDQNPELRVSIETGEHTPEFALSSLEFSDGAWIADPVGSGEISLCHGERFLMAGCVFEFDAGR